MPGQVIVRPRGIAHAPVRHGALRVVLEGLVEALDRLAVVEAVEPVEPPVEPELCLRRRRGDFTAVWPKIEIRHVFPQSLLAKPQACPGKVQFLVPAFSSKDWPSWPMGGFAPLRCHGAGSALRAP